MIVSFPPPLFQLQNSFLNLRDLLEDIDDTTSADLLEDIPGSTVFFDLEGDLTGRFYSFFGSPYPGEEPSWSTVFWINNETEFVAAFSLSGLDNEVTFDNGFSLIELLSTQTNILYNSLIGGVNEGFNQVDIMRGYGTMFGRGGDDVFELGFETAPGDPSRGDARTLAYGNLGEDTFYISTELSSSIGGWGDDTFVAVSGTMGLIGGLGADTFIFDNAAAEGESTFAILRGFNVAEDTLIFADTEGNNTPDPDTLGPATSFADLFNTTDLSTLSAQTVGGVTFFFGHAADGDARIFRRGEDADGNTYHENVRFDGLSLADLDASQIFQAEFSALL